MAKKEKTYYAVVNKNGKMIRQENNHLHPILVFDNEAGAAGAVWKSGERVIQVDIVRRD